MKPKNPILERNVAMAMDRARGATLREIAAKYGVSLTQTFRIVGNVTISPPGPITAHELVPLPDGGFTYHVVILPPPRPRVYWVRDGKRVYPGDENFPRISD